MKNTGIVRKIDDLGRIVIPRELRRTLDIDIKDSLEIYTEGDRIIIKKYDPGCVLCGQYHKNLLEFKGKLICKKCLLELGAIRSEE